MQAMITAVLAAALMLAGTARAGQTNGTEKKDGPALPAGVAINVMLDHALDSKKAKVGESVVARTTEDAKQGGRVVLPKGSKLTGHVTQSSARSKGDNNSTLALRFDRVEVKGGHEEMPLDVNLEALAPPPAAAPIGGQDLEGMGNSGSPSGMPNRGGGMPGAGTGSAGRTTTTTPMPRNTDSPPPGPPADPGSSSGTLIRQGSHGVYGLEGLSLETAAAGSGQGAVIVSAGKSVHLDGGTRMLLLTAGDKE